MGCTSSVFCVSGSGNSLVDGCYEESECNGVIDETCDQCDYLERCGFCGEYYCRNFGICECSEECECCGTVCARDEMTKNPVILDYGGKKERLAYEYFCKSCIDEEERTNAQHEKTL